MCLYPEESHSSDQQRRYRKEIVAVTASDYIQTITVIGLLFALILLTINKSFAEQNNTSYIPSPAPIFFTTRNSHADDRLTITDALSEDLYFTVPTMDRAYFDRDKDLPFNYLWMRQYHDDYRYRKGGSAAGKIFRQTIRDLYRSYTQKTNSYSSKQAYKGNMESFLTNDLDYRLRISSSKLKIWVKYEF